MLIGTSAVGLNDIKTTPVSIRRCPASRSTRRCWRAALTSAVLSQPTYGVAVEFVAAMCSAFW